MGQNIDTLEAFRRSKNASLLETYDSIRSRFGLPAKLSEYRSFQDVDRDELHLVLNAYADLRRDLARLQWFDRVNKDAAERILTKLERLGQATTNPHRRHKIRWLMLQHVLGSTSLISLESLDILIADVRRAITEAESGTRVSLFLVRVFDQHSQGLRFRDSLCLAFRDGEAGAVKILESMQQDPRSPRSSFDNLLREVLEYSVLIRPNQLASSLLSSSLYKERCLIDHDLLNRFIIVTGQKAREGVDAPGTRRPETSPNNQNAHVFTQMLTCLGYQAKDRRAHV